jgi:hypothetical protein
MNKLFGGAALIGFVCALAVHLLTFGESRLQPELSGIWILHVGLFFVFVPMIFSVRRRFGQKLTHHDLLSLLPVWATRLVAIVFVYVIVNFALFALNIRGGSPGVHAGAFVIQDHGRVIQEISESQYRQLQAYVIRGFSGHWLVFYLVPALYFLAGRPRQ